MASITSGIEAMQGVFGEQADGIGRTNGFSKRQRKLRGASFAQGLIC